MHSVFRISVLYFVFVGRISAHFVYESIPRHNKLVNKSAHWFNVSFDAVQLLINVINL